MIIHHQPKVLAVIRVIVMMTISKLILATAVDQKLALVEAVSAVSAAVVSEAVELQEAGN